MNRASLFPLLAALTVAVPAAVLSSIGLAVVGLGWSVVRIVGAATPMTDRLPWLPTVLRSVVVAALVVVGLSLFSWTSQRPVPTTPAT